jgi:hypothetical protein
MSIVMGGDFAMTTNVRKFFRPFLPKSLPWAAFVRRPTAEVVEHYEVETRRNRRLKALTEELLSNLNRKGREGTHG